MNIVDHRNTVIHIDTHKLMSNVAKIKALAPNAKLLAMVKADAYGHGIENIIPYLDADGFGVACLSEALRVFALCQKKAKKTPIVLMEGVFSAKEWAIACRHDFAVLIKDEHQGRLACQSAPIADGFAKTVWLKYNTGMNRLGFDEAGVVKMAKALIDCGYQVVLISHFGCADDLYHPLNAKQIQRFEQVYRVLVAEHGHKIQASLCNSAGIVNFPYCHYDWVRAGIALYGGNPLYANMPHQENPWQAVMSFSSQIMAIHHVQRGQSVGYGALWQAKQDSVIGVVAVGYGDGYPRTIQDGVVLIDGQKIPIVGRVAMDMLMVDLTALPEQENLLGKAVVLWNDELTCDEVAWRANTISYELFCKMSMRPIRCVI